MGLSDDEVHIELGRMYKNENKLKHKIDSLEKEIRLNLESIQYNYEDIKNLQQQQQNLRQQLDRHGLFR